MQTVGGHLVPGAALLAGAWVCQWLLGEIRFSTVKAETVFRVLFAVPAALDAILLLRRGRRSGVAWRLWPMAVPVWAVAGLMAAALAESDAQGAIFVFMLPFAHVVMSLICYLTTRPNKKAGSA